MSNSAHNISHEEIVEIKLIINNLLAVMMALSEMSLKQERPGAFAKFFAALRRPDYSEKLASTVLTKAPLILSSLQEFTQALNEKAGPELQDKFSEIKRTINNVLSIMMVALSEMSQRRPEFSEKLASTVLTKAPLIVSGLQEFTQALNEKAGPQPEVGQ
jgi:hypothetical protein